MVRPCWKKEKLVEEERKIKANNSEYNKIFNYANNHIKTSKYNLVSFLPLNLFEQFQRLANFYFLCLVVLQLIPQISSLTPVTTIVPLACVLALTALKDGVDDIQRHRNDNQVNNRISNVLRGNKLVEERWHKVQVGDIIRMENDHFVAADLLLLSTSEPHGLCYIETAELDGETNLKCRQAIPETAELGEDIEQMGRFDGEITCEAPNNNLNRFEGMLLWKDQTYSLDNDKMLLRGCILRNTKWCYGVVVFAGRDTKLMQNSGKAKLKRTSIDRLLNVLIVNIVFALFTICLFCTVACGFWEMLHGQYFTVYLQWDSIIPSNFTKPASITVISLLVFFSYAIVLNTVVPISLYVSVEIIRFGHSWWINWDEEMRYKKSGTFAKSRTTTLNEELGQIEYIFSDKTGTLTQNIMTFNKCSINCTSYGDITDKDGNPVDVSEDTPKVDFSWNPHHEHTFTFYDLSLVDNVRSGNKDVEKFFRLLALCHTVMVDDKDGQLEYQAQSPDEAALVSAARNFGFVFKSRTPTTITIEVHGTQEVYDLLCILDFNNVRKRMSVIIRRNNRIQLLCKGADSIIYGLLGDRGMVVRETTADHLNSFASEGLRTLCLAEKDISPEVYEEWKNRHHEASTAMEDRQEKLDKVYEEIEQDMTLIGATAIEDKLQEGVPDTIANLALAEIKLWVLTGDKLETAINIGYSCKLLTDDMQEIFIVEENTYDAVERRLVEIRNQIRSIMNVEGATGVRFKNTMNDHDQDNEEVSGFALVISGYSLVHALNAGLEKLLLEVGTDCKSVICCRVTPLQKALVVELVKKYKKAVTLAIGDGANDVSMIKTAHIGVGISGQEGLQAVLASDFSIAQFRYLERLLLVHGRWSYFRMCKFLQYFFYKNFAFTLCHFWYAFFCGFSAQTLFDPWFISFYNLFYTALPVLALGVFDQDVNDVNSIKNSKLYIPGHQSLFFNRIIFLRSVAHGIITSLVLFFIPFGAFHNAIRATGLDMDGLQALGVAVASILVITVTFQIALDTSYWTFVNFFVIFGSVIFYIGMTFFMYSDFLVATYLGTAESVLSTAQFWFTLVLTLVILMVPVVAVRFFHIDCKPTLSDRIRIKQHLSRIKSRPSQINLRPRSSLRRSRRSLRSGYAFAHQEGFGELITTGTNMRIPAQSPSLVRYTKSAGEMNQNSPRVTIKQSVETFAPNRFMGKD